MIDQASFARFAEARIRVLGESVLDSGIGRLSEKSLHKILKLYIEPQEELHEKKRLGSVADILNDDGIYEIQTGSFERLLPKLEKFLPNNRVCVVVPIICEKTVRWLDKSTGEVTEPRKSPKKETPYTAFRELYKIRRFLTHENLSIRMIFLRAEEFKYLDGWDRSKKRGATKIDRIPTALLDDITINSKSDYLRFIPDSLRVEFTARELSLAAQYPARISSYVTGLLRTVGVIQFVRKEGRAYVYKTVLNRADNIVSNT